MSEAKHTPGPWVVDPCWDILGSTDDGNGMVCQITTDAVPRAEAIANARLIAAAPETTDALRKLVNEVSALGGFGPEIEALIGVTNWRVLMTRVQEAREVLAKAEGQP